MSIFIPVDIMEDVVESVSQEILGGSGPGGKDLEALQGWLLKFGEDSKKLRISAEIFVEWLANNNIPWEAYPIFMTGRLIVLDKQPVVHPVGIGETWTRLFSNWVMKVTVPEATNACHHRC